MAVKSKKEIMDSLSKVLGENNSDDALALLEDVSDTLDTANSDLPAKLQAAEDKYNELDKSWREKYRARFLQSKEDAAEQDNEFKKEQEEQEQKAQSSPAPVNTADSRKQMGISTEYFNSLIGRN